MPKVLSPWRALVWVISLAAAAGSGFWAGHSRARLEGEATLAQYKQDARDRYDQAQAGAARVSGAYETSKQEAQQRHDTVETRIREIYRTLPAQPLVCEPPASALRLLNAQIAYANASAAGQPRPELPAAEDPAAAVSGP